jgi:hypothetical protein
MTDASLLPTDSSGTTYHVSGSTLKTYVNNTAGNIIPAADNTYFLGNATNRWANIWLGPGTIYITDSNVASNLTAELTVFNGVLQVNGVPGLQANLIAGNTSLTLDNSSNITLNIAGSSNSMIVSSGVTEIAGNLSVLGDTLFSAVNIATPLVNTSAMATTDNELYLSGNSVAGVGDIVIDPFNDADPTTGNVTLLGNLSVSGNISYTPAYGQFWSNLTQTVSSANTAYTFLLNNTDGHNLIELGSGASNSRIIINKTGLYNIQFSAQIDKTAGGGGSTAYIWFKKNGTAVPDTGGFFTLDNTVQTVQSWNIMANVVAAGDYYEIAYAATNTNFRFPTLAGNVAVGYSASPSIIVTVTPVGV